MSLNSHSHLSPAGRPSRRLGVAVGAVGLAVLAAACSSSGGGGSAAKATSSKLQTVTVAAVPSEGAAGLYIGLDEGLFKKAGLNVKIQETQSSTDVIGAMASGATDVDYGAYTAYIAVDAKKVQNVRVVAPGFSLGPHVQEIIVSDKSHITSLAGLKGKTIEVNILGGIEADLLYRELSSYGIKPSQVHLVAVPFPEMAQELAAGKVDAMLTNEPYVTETVKEDKVQELADMNTGASVEFPISGYGMLASWIKKNPSAAAAFVKTVEQGNAIAATHLTALQQAMTTQLHLSPDITGVMATGTFPTSVNPVQLQRVADLMLKYGQLSTAFNVKPIIGS